MQILIAEKNEETAVLYKYALENRNHKVTSTLNGIDCLKEFHISSDKLVYSWRQLSGLAVKLNGTDTTNPTFTAPKVSSDTALKFSLTVKDV